MMFPQSLAKLDKKSETLKRVMRSEDDGGGSREHNKDVEKEFGEVSPNQNPGKSFNAETYTFMIMLMLILHQFFSQTYLCPFKTNCLIP